MTFWPDAPPEPPAPRFGATDWLRIVIRGVFVGTLTFGGLALLLLVRLIERPIFGMARPVTPYITKTVCRGALWFMGITYVVRGRAMQERGAIVANHGSWLDIFVLNAAKRIYFVSKAEVAGWPGIGWLARATGTVFIARDPRQARAQKEIFEQRLLAGHKLLFFPEGTSTDGRVVLPFKTTLFAAFFTDELRHELHIQPVTVAYHAPPGEGERFYGWWGDMSFGPHLLKVLAARRQGTAEVIYHAPLRVDDFPNRKTLAKHAETLVRSGHEAALRGSA
ncbi:lysophospholipid acyltransferase family protein [Primorskyibacter sp. S187A]|uniref:lysophospholipid acyltransferase family protein n=1 Tax=Primorskyibacter sp. S187A TaxID=3415130 RepID=UPI003C7A2489